ncbi:energy transducer TonB [Flavobacterium algicola]|uniref:energy transducer TonB n=1 Tax=Flavobacterium algicola TaxID=556529 RepID=UPI001EFD659C|nr:energy transducer TonB [Flavobacterium algicola]MCG9791350.1 energy transducer TonB [Flavobacterium algicola]
MKAKLLLLLLLFVSTINNAQDKNDKKIFLDSHGKKTTEKKHSFYLIILDYKSDKKLYQVAEYNKNGILLQEGTITDKEKLTKEGKFTTYYKSGNKEKVVHYTSSSLNGEFEQWYEDGNKHLDGIYIAQKNNSKSDLILHNYWNKENKQILINGTGEYEETIQFPDVDSLNEENSFKKVRGTAYGPSQNYKKEGQWTGSFPKLKITFVENYKNGELIEGKSTDSLGIQKKYNVVEQKPVFRNGIKDFYIYVAKNFNIPFGLKNIALTENKINVSFIIKKNGSVDNIKILKGLTSELNYEAIKVIENSPDWVPGKNRGQLIDTLFYLPITINLPTSR